MCRTSFKLGVPECAFDDSRKHSNAIYKRFSYYVSCVAIVCNITVALAVLIQRRLASLNS